MTAILSDRVAELPRMKLKKQVEFMGTNDAFFEVCDGKRKDK